MPFYRYFTKNNSQGVVINDTSSQITFQAGHTLPTNVTSGEFLLTLGGPGGEIVKVTSAAQDGSGVLTVDVSREQENTSYLDATSGTVGYLYLTAGMFNKAYDILEEHETKLNYMTITQAVNLDTLESDTATNNAKVTNANHTGDVTGSGVLGIVPAAISGRTGVTPVSGDYLLLWDATDSSLKKVDASNFLSGAVSSVNTFTGAVTLVTGNISDTTSAQKYVTASDITKLGYISVTQAVDLDTMESNISTNNAKVTNATHTGDVTGADVLGIVPAAISGRTSVTAVSGDYVLIWDATDSTLKKANVSDFISGGGGAVDSVNGYTGVITLVTADISDTTSTQKYVTASDITKLGYISVTQAVDLDTMESNISNNNAKVTNADHTGDVTGSLGLTIVPSAISGKTSVTAVSGDYLLLWDATDSSLKKVNASDFLSAGGGTGDVTGPASSTNTGVAIFNGTDGKTLMNSLVTVDTSSVTIPGFLTVTGQARNSEQTALSTSAIVTWNINNNPKANIIMTNDVTSFTISGINLNSEATLYISQNATVAKTITWPGTIIWAGGSTPDLSELSSKHIISLFSYDGTGLIAAHISDTFVSGGGAVDSVNTFTGAVTLVTGNISDTTSAQKYVTASDITKLGYISVTQAVDLDTMESNISTNNAKVTNANHTGDVTGADVLGIVPAAISGKTSVTPVSGDYVLLWDATDSALKKADVSTFISGGGGDVTGPASATNTGIAIYNGTGGKTLMSSLVTIDTSSITIPGFLTVTGQARQSAQATLTTSGTVTWNINNDPSAKLALAGDVTSFTISGINLNSNAILYITQGAVTAYTISWPTITWAGGYAPNISTLSSKHVISFFSYDGTGLFGSIVSDTSLSTLSSSSGTTVLNAIAIYDSTTGLAIKDSIATLDVSGNFDSVGTINGVSFNTLAADTTTNNAKVSNATHTGDVIGSTSLTIDPTAISGKTGVTPVAGDYVLLWDATDSLMKKADVTNFISAVTASSATTFTNKRITKRVQPITDATGLVFDADSYDSGYVTLTASRTLNNFSGTPTNHQQAMIEFIQGGSGSYTVTMDTTGAGAFRLGADVTGLVLSTAVGKRDLALFTYLSDATGWCLTALTKGF